MGHSVTLGGDRVGSGNKNKVYLHNYERSTHDLSTDFLSTMGCGMLIPFMCELVTRDDKYEIDLSAGLRTIPTKGPLFGSFKLQLDVYQCPLRLYQALLHNNPLAIGLKASQVKFPKMSLYGNVPADTTTFTELKSANNSLVKYLGISGIGTAKGNQNEVTQREMFASGVLAYYDIFKNYYANKQEEDAYTLIGGAERTNGHLNIDYVFTSPGVYGYVNNAKMWNATVDANNNIEINTDDFWADQEEASPTGLWQKSGFMSFLFNITAEDPEYEVDEFNVNNLVVTIQYYKGGTLPRQSATGTLHELQKQGRLDYVLFDHYNTFGGKQYNLAINPVISNTLGGFEKLTIKKRVYYYTEGVSLRPFKLKTIDDMRYDILSFHQLGQSYILDGDGNIHYDTPYWAAIGDSTDTNWQKDLAGICVKTYQSDLYNNWLDTEIIDGDNGIAAITAINTQEGSFTIDALQFSEKLYNLLNRIAVSGGTYEDYLDAAYTDSAKKFSEAPLWVGGMSDEIIFEEIVQTAPAEGDKLGTLGGRGNLMGKTKGGKITVKIDEPSLLIGIVSITPRIVYTQGNTWFNTEIDNLADIHVPALDAIGFENLIGEQLHFGSTIIGSDLKLQERPIIGKIPAWIHYMTNVDRAYGDFAATDGDGYMVLNRNYECLDGQLQDATTYIDPAKYNYAFAYTKRGAQNFWVKIKADIKARRLMSAKQIPTA